MNHKNKGNMLYCFKCHDRTVHTKKNDLQYYCMICGETNGYKYSSLGSDDR